jgi:predicted DNA-binding protein with PD1-like motif
MRALPLRLLPGHDLRHELEAALARDGGGAGFVLSGIGSLSEARIRFAGVAEPERIEGDLEVVSLAGTIAANGSHLHAVLSTATGEVVGGHVGFGCIVRTTAEVLLAVLDEWQFQREADASTGFDELAMRRSPTAS